MTLQKRVAARYAATTTVDVEKTRLEIEHLAKRHGATHFEASYDEAVSSVSFVIEERLVRFELHLPDKLDDEFWVHPQFAWKRQNASKAHGLWLAEEKRQWRALFLCLKAKFEAVETGMTSYADEFLANTVTTSGALLRDLASVRQRA